MNDLTTVGHQVSYYKPKENDVVIGIVIKRSGDDWLVDIGDFHKAILPYLSFPDATKSSYPKFNQGDIIAALVEEVPECGEVKLTCIHEIQKLGPLNGGALVRCRQSDIEKIDEFQYFSIIAQKFPLTCAKGQNGRLWLDANDPIISIQLANAIISALSNPDDNPVDLFNSLIQDIFIVPQF